MLTKKTFHKPSLFPSLITTVLSSDLPDIHLGLFQISQNTSTGPIKK